jgi:preprotein translocase subunit SecG
MNNIILTIHLILAFLLISAVLMQRSEGGGLGSTGGSDGGLMSGRSAATAMTKLTWFFASAFLITSITLTVIAANESRKKSIININTADSTENSLSIPLPDTETLDLINQQEAPTLPPAEEEIK